ncbi:hypothetical protein [Aeromonas veronii]|uniref:hypothetical protein n=1 Tax=Aeromonas veronii TaxID=654 RepID=UPI003BA17AA1
MNLVTQQFTKEQYKALYEAQQLGVRFDCYLLAPGHNVWKGDLPLIDELLVSPPLQHIPTLLVNDDTKYRHIIG